jgi:hypothetical protein
MATLAAHIRDAGREVAAIDLFGSAPWRFAERDDYLLQGTPLRLDDPRIADADLLGLFAISAMAHSELVGMVTALRDAFPERPIVVFENSQAVTGYDIAAKRRDFFRAGANALVAGLPFDVWDRLLEWLGTQQKEEPPKGVIASSDPDRPIERSSSANAASPIPAWDLFPLREYWRLPYSHGPKTGRYLPILTSFGCPFPCDFCVIPRTNSRRWRPRNPHEVADEMIALRRRFGVRHFHVEDVNPTVSRSHWRAISERLIEQKADVLFYFVSGTRADTLKSEDLDLYHRAGLRYLSFSPESGSPSVLEAVGKPFDYEHAVALVKRSYQLRIATQACFIVGHPAEKESDHKQSLAYLRRLVRAGLSEAVFFGVSPVPGSSLYDRGAIALRDRSALTSFSPKGRADWKTVRRRRLELTQLLFFEKLRRPRELMASGLRAAFGRPQTKIENVPRRVWYVSRNIARSRATSAIHNLLHLTDSAANV